VKKLENVGKGCKKLEESEKTVKAENSAQNM
jgi:hypothetical protein